MSENKIVFAIRTTFRVCICAALLLSANYALGQTEDDDTTLEFYWSAASGNVHHYNVYLYINGVQHSQVWTTSVLPSSGTPYAVPIVAEDGKTYELSVQAVDASGATGPMSERSDPVLCRLRQRSPGDVNGSTAGDANGDSRVGAGDWQILCKALGTQYGAPSFDYRADLNYDGSVNNLDVDIMKANWGNIYGN